MRPRVLALSLCCVVKMILFHRVSLLQGDYILTIISSGSFDNLLGRTCKGQASCLEKEVILGS